MILLHLDIIPLLLLFLDSIPITMEGFQEVGAMDRFTVLIRIIQDSIMDITGIDGIDGIVIRIYNNGYVGNRQYNSDYNQTVARIKSGRGEKNYNDSSRTSNTKDRNAKTNESITVNNTINRINRGRGFNSLGNTYIINNDRNTTLNTKSSVNSRTPRPVYGNSLNSSINGSTNTSPNKSVQTNTQGRFIQSRSRLGERNSTNTTQPVRVRRSTPTYPSSGSTTRSYNNTQRTYSQPSRKFNSSPSSYNSGNRSSSGSSGSSSGRGSSGRRN